MTTSRYEWLRLLMLISGFTAVSLGCAGIIGNTGSPQFYGDTRFLSLVYAAVLLTCGVLLVIGRYRRSLTLASGLVSLALLCIVYGAAWADWLGFGAHPFIAVISSSVTAGGAIAAIFLGRSPPLQRVHEWHSTAVAAVGVLLAVTSSFSLSERDRLHVNQYVVGTSERSASHLSGTVSHVVALIHRMGERWSLMDGGVSERLYERDFASYLRDFSTIGKLSVFDADGIEVISREQIGYSHGWRSEAADTRVIAEWIQHVASQRDPKFSPIMREKDDGFWGLIAVPTKLSNSAHVIVAQVNLTRVIERILTDTEVLAHFRVEVGDRLLYETAGGSTRRISPTVYRAVDLHNGVQWHLSVYLTVPAGGVGAAALDALPEIYLVVGLVVTLAVAASLRFSQIARRRSLELRAAEVTDALTGLHNRSGFEAALRNAITHSRLSGTPLGVISVSISGVELVNDSLGHSVGDALLKEAARRLRSAVVGSGTVARHGDDAFLVLHYDKSLECIEDFVRLVISSLQRPCFVLGHTLRLSAYAGYTVGDGDTSDPMRLLREADLAMLDSRRGAQHAWQRYTPRMNERATEHLTLINDLQAAIETDALTLNYQPLVNGHTGRVVAVEALLRWRHPQRGAVSPGSFLPLAEETGVIVPLTDQILATACRDSRRLRERGMPTFPVAVNISPRYFRLPDFIERVRDALEAAELEPARLAIEITEGVFLEDEDDAVFKLRALHELGVRTAIDDFGTGYSSLSYLKNLPVDKVKLDRSFIIDIVSDHTSAAIARGVIAMAHHLDLRVIAEGVETEAQYTFLRRSLCDEFQGYFFGRPAPFDELVEQLLQDECRVPLPRSSGDTGAERALLVLDDEPNILNALVRLFRRDGYRVLTAQDPAQAFHILATNEVQVIISDQRMPGMKGTEFFSRVKDLYPDTVRIVLSGYTDLKSVTDAVNMGAIYKFLTKPWDDAELRAEVEGAFAQYAAARMGESGLTPATGAAPGHSA